MTENVETLVRDVRVAIDMNGASEALLVSDDETSLRIEEIIESKIEQAARVIEGRAPVWLLDSGKPLSGSITFQSAIGKGRGRMQLPDDFMRLITFKMSDWERAITEPILESDPRYLLQSSRFTGLRGTPQKPVVAIVSEPTGLVLEFWSCEGGESVTLQRGRYLPMPTISGTGIEICEKLRQAVVVYAGYLTLQTLGHAEEGELLRRQAETLMT